MVDREGRWICHSEEEWWEEAGSSYTVSLWRRGKEGKVKLKLIAFARAHSELMKEAKQKWEKQLSRSVLFVV